MDWAREFYEKQNRWSGVYEEAISTTNREKAALIAEYSGTGSKRVLELGAGGGQASVAMAMLGHTVVAVELVPMFANQIETLASSHGVADKVTVHNTDFYTVALTGQFDVVCYWDGFGIGEDADQRRLLQRISEWLLPTGCALIEIGTPWYAASVDGRGWEVGDAERRYSFDAEGCRWNDTWWPKGKPEKAITQSLRSYSPADLRLLLAETGLKLQSVKSGGVFDWKERIWHPQVPLGRAMNYVAELRLG